MSVELRTLRYFVAAADAGSVNAAAPLVHVTQPAISRQLAQLQTELGVALFDARGGRSTLTAAGRQFLPIARDLLVRADKAREAAASFAAGTLQTMAISAPATTLSDVVAPFLATWGPSDPIPTVIEPATSDAAPALLAGADLAIVTEEPSGDGSSGDGSSGDGSRVDGSSTGEAWIAIAELPIWAYVRSDHPWAHRHSVRVRDLADTEVIALTPDFKPRKILDDAIAEAGLSIPHLMESADAQVAQALAASGRGVAIVSDDPRFGLVPLHLEDDHGPVRIRLFAAWDPDHHASNTLAEVAARLATFCQQRYETARAEGAGQERWTVP